MQNDPLGPRAAGVVDTAEHLDETPDRDGAYPRLTEDQLAALELQGERRPTERGQELFREGDEDYDFHVVLSGKVAVVDGHGTPEARVIAVHGERRFLGELGLLTGEAAFFTTVAVVPGEVLVVPVERVRSLCTADEALGDLVFRAYLLRRELLIGLGAGFRIIGSRFSPDTRRLREFAARNRLPHRWIDLEQDVGADELLRRLGVAPDQTPIVFWHGDVLRNPTNAELARAIGLPAPVDRRAVCDLLVVGAGPSGLAASVYGASEGLDTITVDAVAAGGQAGTSSRIENYLGFPSGISGGELGERALIQARKFGARITIPAEALSLEAGEGHHRVTLADDSELLARTIVIASGARYRRLSVPGIQELEGDSVYYAATMMEAQMCAGDPIVVVGGGNSAGQATLFLCRYATELRLLIRGGSLTRDMSRYLADRIEQTPAVQVMLNTEVRELQGDGSLEAVIAENTRTGERRRLPAKALFAFIGADPHTDWLRDQVALDRNGFVLTGPAVASGSPGEARQPMLLETSCPGILAVGDVRSGSIKRVASAVGEGSMAVRLVHEYLMQTRG
jgi:thioredoxin reductase (NADPH)